MASETFKKRQKETARREKRLKKAARLMERRNQKASAGTDPQEDKREPAGGPATAPNESTKITNPKYFGSPILPRDPKRKSEITLYTTRKR
jgi:hypothetical protein